MKRGTYFNRGNRLYQMYKDAFLVKAIPIFIEECKTEGCAKEKAETLNGVVT